MSGTQELSPTTNGNATNNGADSTLQLDVPKLHSLSSEQQDLYLFTFTSNLEKHIKSLDYDSLCAQQIHLKRELHQIISLSSPAPTRVIRNSLGRCFVTIFGKGDRKSLYESINELLAVVNAGKNEKDLPNRHAAVCCLGDIFKVAGDSAISLSSLVCSSSIRLLKSAQDHSGLRAAIFKALGKVIGCIQGAVDETAARDIWKHARGTASGDKAALAQANACECLEQLIKGTVYFDNISDYDTLKSTIWKTCDSPAPVARRAAAVCLASILVKLYSETALEKSAPKIKKSKKPSKKQSMALGEGDDDSSQPRSPSTPRINASRLEFALPDLLKQLSAQYVRSTTSNRTRAAIAYCYSRVLLSLDHLVVESHYSQIADHFLIDLLNSPLITHHRYRLLLTRKFVQEILAGTVGSKILGESGQINAARILVNEILKNYPQVIVERAEPSKHTLTGALDTLAALIQSLGSAFNVLGDSCRDALMQVIRCPNYTVQIHTSYCLRVFTLACPQQLLQCASICMNSLNRELNLLPDRSSSRRSVGYANGLAAVLSISSLRPLYSSLEISSRVLSIATGLLKTSSNTELRTSIIQVQVAWILIGGLMALGPNFVKIHISQLLLLWRNALPKPLTRENTGRRQSVEISYLTHIREYALGSMLSFLEFNSRLVTVDVSKRIAAMLQNTIEFLENIPSKKGADETSTRISSSLLLQDLVVMIRRRVLQCYTRLVNFSPVASGEILTQSNLLTWAVTFFADPESYSPGSLGSSISNSAGNFESIWDVADNSGFGVSGLVRGLEIKPLPGERSVTKRPHWLLRKNSLPDFDKALLSPICGAREYDAVYLHKRKADGLEDLPDPPATEVVNSAIALFASTLPLQDARVQEGVLEQLSTLISSNSLHRDPGRKAAVTINTAMALLGALKVAVGETLAGSGNLRHPAVEKCLRSLLRGFIFDQDQFIRNIAYEGLGRLCNSSGNLFTANEVHFLIDTIVANRDPIARAGCAMALGSIHSHVGGMAAGYHLQRIHGIIMSLCSDPHPAVHFWAIEALSQVAESSGLTFSGYVSSTLGLLAQLWTSDSHNKESASLATTNFEVELPTAAAIANTVDSLINVLGPDLQDMSKPRELMFTLIQQFEVDDLPIVQAQGLRCWEHVYLYASGHVDIPRYVRQLQKDISSTHEAVRKIAIDGLYSLIRRDSEQVLEVAEEGLDEQIWLALNENPDQEGVQNIVETWIEQTGLSETERWIMRCQQVLTKSTAKVDDTSQPLDTKASAAPDLQDEEVAGFATGNVKEQDLAIADAGQELLKWQVRGFALKCLSHMIANIGVDMESNPESSAGLFLQHKIADVIRMAFLASTSSVVELCVSGLKIIDQVLMIFGNTPDPDFAEALLLEQYQAQISSALTPAFSADSSPALASAAVSVCATFIATGLVTDVDRMGRILKLLVAGLDSFTSGDQDIAVGDLRGLSANAQTMVKMAVLSAWAELQIASVEQTYLVKVVEPYVAKLTPLWLSSLQEFARLRFEPDISSNAGPARLDESLDTMYAALNRQTLLKFYQDSWLKLVDAIASLIDQDSDFVFDALDGNPNRPRVDGASTKESEINYRDEPVAFFFVLFGIVIEALVTHPSNDTPNARGQTLEILLALKKILRPSVSGNAIFQDVVFSETIEVFNRLVLTEGQDVQAVTVDIVRNLCSAHSSAKEDDNAGDHLSDDIEQLFELTKVIVLVLASAIPNLRESTSTVRQQIPDEAIPLIRLSLEALVDASEVFPSIIRTDLYASILHIFATILSTGVCQSSIVPQALPIFRRFIQTITSTTASATPNLTLQLRGCLHRFLSILANAQRRESETSLLCAKNILLASTVLLTTGSSTFLHSDPLLTRLLDSMLDCLQDIGLAKVATSCIRSLLLTVPKSPTTEATARYLLPRLLRFITNTSEPDPENARALVAHCVTSFVATLDGTLQVSAALSLVLPTLLARAAAEGKEVWRETAARVLELASVDQGTFRGVVGRMSGEERGFMEGVLREGALGGGGGGNGRGEERGGARGEPSIALKLSFGGV